MSHDTQAAPACPARPLSSRLVSARRWLSANNDANTYRLCLVLFLVGASLGLMARSSTPNATAPVAAQEGR